MPVASFITFPEQSPAPGPSLSHSGSGRGPAEEDASRGPLSPKPGEGHHHRWGHRLHSLPGDGRAGLALRVGSAQAQTSRGSGFPAGKERTR